MILKLLIVIISSLASIHSVAGEMIFIVPTVDSTVPVLKEEIILQDQNMDIQKEQQSHAPMKMPESCSNQLRISRGQV